MTTLSLACSLLEDEPFVLEEEQLDEVICYQIDQPEFPGGVDSLLSFVYRNLQWPSPDHCAEGVAVIGFTVDKDGAIKDPEVIRSLGLAFDEEALRILSLMPNWIPAKHFDKPIKSRYFLPIRFTLE